jgi:hypothetical protein
MWINGIEIEISGKLNLPEVNDPDIFIPSSAAIAGLAESVKSDRAIAIKIECTDNPDLVAVAIGPTGVGPMNEALEGLRSNLFFGFLLDRSELEELHAALGSAIAAVTYRKPSVKSSSRD